MTNDADVMVAVQTLADFETLKEKLAGYGFERTRVPYRLRHTTGGLLDILPYSESIAPDGRLELQDGVGSGRTNLALDAAAETTNRPLRSEERFGASR
jgi:hypothetical protein